MAIPPWGGAPYLNEFIRNPNWSLDSLSERPRILKTFLCIFSLWIRIDPPPISFPLRTKSYAFDFTRFGFLSNSSKSASLGAVKG